MRSNKAYTNVTFTKRVDADGGAHRPSRAPAGKALCCQTCGALYFKRRWVTKDDSRAAEDNPLSRILTWDHTPLALTVGTTTEHLVERLGHALTRAYKGDMDYGFSHKDKFARGSWRRE